MATKGSISLSDRQSSLVKPQEDFNIQDKDHEHNQYNTEVIRWPRFSDHPTGLPVGCEFVCSYVNDFGIDDFDKGVVFKRTSKRDELWMVCSINPPDQSEVSHRNGSMFSASKSDRISIRCFRLRPKRSILQVITASNFGLFASFIMRSYSGLFVSSFCTANTCINVPIHNLPTGSG